MRPVLFLILFLTALSLRAQPRVITLRDCIDAALANRPNIQALRTDLMIADLQQSEAKGKYIPQIALAYEYNYNPIIATQVIPTGQFLPVPTDEFRPIRFGTPWQQNAGLTVYQPILDYVVRSRMSESELESSLRQADLDAAAEDLTREIIQAFGNMLVHTRSMADAAADTARTLASLQDIESLFAEGRLLKTEANRARLNHNTSRAAHQASAAALIREKIYLGFLTGIPLPDILDATPDFSPLEGDALAARADVLTPDSSAVFGTYALRQQLLDQQVRTLKRQYTPALGVQGAIGANQFTETFNPFENGSWYASSYVGLSLQLPILGSENTSARTRQLALEREKVALDRTELLNQRTTEFYQAREDARRITRELDLHTENIVLLEENVHLLSTRLTAGQATANELNAAELDLQKEKAAARSLEAELIRVRIDQLVAGGGLRAFAASVGKE